MDVNLYVLEARSRDRLAELRAGAAAHGLALAAVPLRRRFRSGVGRVLIRLGTWVLGSSQGSLARHTS
jgi:hypothetical protein